MEDDILDDRGEIRNNRFAKFSFYLFIAQVVLYCSIMFSLPWAAVMWFGPVILIPFLFPLLGIYFAFKSHRRNESALTFRWIGGIGNGILLLGESVLLFMII